MKIIKFISHHLIIVNLYIIIFGNALYANNIQISNVQITDKNTTEHWANIRFDLSFNNAWRINTGASNWCAAWIFIKFRKSDGIWRHASLSVTDAHHIMPANVTGDPSPDGKGIFIYDSRANIGNINFSADGVVIRWKYGADGVVDTENSIDIKLFGIEMVYVPTNPYYLGSGGNESGHFYTFGGNSPFLVNSENSYTIGTTSGDLYYNNDNPPYSGDQNGPIPAAFPKGFNAYYFMRYEISQQQYVDFLNHLSRLQQIPHVASDISVSDITNTYVMTNTTNIQYRNGIRCPATGNGTTNPVQFFCDLDGDGIGNEINDGSQIACTNLNWSDLLAYCDWSGLRPSTELEFEKSCRGTNLPVIEEYAWGSTAILQSTGLLFSGTVLELSTDFGNGLSNFNNSVGPYRCGFAAKIFTNNRVSAGISFYGISDLSGNVTERCISIGSPEGRAFTGLHGDGELLPNGDANVLGWPDSRGLSLRGGHFNASSDLLIVSTRYYGAYNTSLRSPFGCGRGVRKAE